MPTMLAAAQIQPADPNPSVGKTTPAMAAPPASPKPSAAGTTALARPLLSDCEMTVNWNGNEAHHEKKKTPAEAMKPTDECAWNNPTIDRVSVASSAKSAY